MAEVEALVRYGWIDTVLARSVKRSQGAVRSRSDLADKILTHRVLGLVVLALLMGGVFQSIYAWAVPLMDGIDGLFAWLGGLVRGVVSPGAVRSLLVDGVLAGAGAVLVFLPQIVILFLFLALLEDCGYLARAALLLDRYMRWCGLSGKSFVPMLSSFACAIPGIMATRAIEDRRDRLVTIVVAPLMGCSARLPVYILLISAFVPPTQYLGGVIGLQTLALLSMYFVGIFVAVVIAFLLKRTVVRGQSLPFLIELPCYKWPRAKAVFYRAYEAGREFVRTAGTVIIAASIIIWAMGYYPRSASIAAEFSAQRDAVQARYQEGDIKLEDSTASGLHQAVAQAIQEEMKEIDRAEAGASLRNSLLGRMGLWVEPAVAPLGWDWRIGTAVIASFPAREVVISTMATIYNLGGEATEDSVALRTCIKNATWPDGRKVFNLPVALSIMVFIALCCQCVSTLAVIKRETGGWRWPIFTFVYMTSLAYVGALVTYQVAIRVIA